MRINFKILNNIKLTRPNYSRANGFVVSNPFSGYKIDTFEPSFGMGSYCSPKNFQVKNLENLHCPACGLVMLTDKQITQYVNYVSSKRGQELHDALERYEDESVITNKPSKDKTGFGIYRPFKKEIVDIYKEMALEYPGYDLLELTQLQAMRCIKSLIAQQMAVVEELREYISQNFSEEDATELLKKIDGFEKQIKGEEEEHFARRKFVSAIKAMTDDKCAKEVDEILSKMPSSESDANSFFVKYSRVESPREIASQLVQRSTPTTEHLKPQAHGGSNSFSNYICDCEDCNSKRGITPFYDWIQTLPGFEERLQDYLNDVRMAIDNDKLDSKYDGYIESIVEVLEDMSEGEIILDVPEVTNPQKRALALKRREREIARLKNEHNRLCQTVEQFASEVKELEASQGFREAYQYGEITREIDEINLQLASLSESVQKLKAIIIPLQRKVEALKKDLAKAKTPLEKAGAKEALEQKEAQYRQKEEELALIEKRIIKLKRKKIAFKKQRKPYSVQENQLNERIETLRSIMARTDALSEKKDKLGNFEQKEVALRKRMSEIDARVDELKQYCAQISSKEGFLASNTSQHKRYFHQKELLRVADTILQNRTFRKIDSSSGLTKEVIEIAQKTIAQNVQEFEQMDEVRYFIYLDELSALERERVKLGLKLNEVVALSKEAASLQEQIDLLCQGKTPDEIRAEFNRLSCIRRTMYEIFKIDAKRAQLENMTRVIQRNEAAFRELEDYQSLTNAQYSDAVSRIVVDEVF